MSTRGRQHHIVDTDESRRFNLLREQMVGKELDGTEMSIVLNNRMNYSMACGRMLRALSEGVNPPIIKTKRGRYCMNPKPVHMSRLQLAWDMYRKFSYPEKYNNIEREEAAIKAAITLLKNAGYKVFKPTIEYKET